MVSAPAQRGRPETVGRSEGDRPLPVLPALEPLFPAGGLRRGSAVAVRGSASLLLALLAGPSGRGAWCGVVGLPGLGLAAAAEAGIALERLALVPDPGRDWAAVAAALLDAMEVVVVAPRGRVPDADVRRLAARARQRGAVLVPFGPVPVAGGGAAAEPGRRGLGGARRRVRPAAVAAGGGPRGRPRVGGPWSRAGAVVAGAGRTDPRRPRPARAADPARPRTTPAPTPHLHAVPTPPSPPPTPDRPPRRRPPRRTPRLGEPADGWGFCELRPAGPPRRRPGEPAQPVIAALWQDVTHRPGARPPVVRRSDGPAPTHPRPVGPPRRTPRTPPARTAATPADRPATQPPHRTPTAGPATQPPAPHPPGAHRDTAPHRSPAGAHRDPTARTESPADAHRDRLTPRHPWATSSRAAFADGGSRPRPAGPPVPAGRPAPVGGGHPAPPTPDRGPSPRHPGRRPGPAAPGVHPPEAAPSNPRAPEQLRSSPEAPSGRRGQLDRGGLTRAGTHGGGPLPRLAGAQRDVRGRRRPRRSRPDPGRGGLRQPGRLHHTRPPGPRASGAACAAASPVPLSPAGGAGRPTRPGTRGRSSRWSRPSPSWRPGWR
jgi:hypothetical protein